MQRRRKNDLSLFATHRHLCDGCDHWEAEYEDMITINLDLPDGMYQVHKGELWKYEFNPPELGNGTKYVTINAVAEPKKPLAQDDELQHVGYDDEQCGRTK